MARNDELVIASGDTAVVFEFVEEALDEVALSLEPGREADGIAPVALGWDVGPATAASHHGAQPVSIIGPVCKHHLTVADIGEQFGRRLDVVGLAGRDDDLYRQAIGIGQSI